MKHTITILLAILPLMAYAQKSSFEQFFDKVQTQTFSADFSISIADKATEPITYNGKIQMLGNKFIASSFGIQIAYDGNNLFMYDEDSNELTISSPTTEELAEANPLIFAKTLIDISDTEEITDAIHVNTIITPHRTFTGIAANISKIMVVLNKTDFIPTKIIIKENSGRNTTALISNQQFSSLKPNFQLSIPDAYTNDMR